MFLVSELCFFYYNIDINQYKLFFAAESSIFQSRWVQNALTVAGGNEEGNKLNQLSSPYGMFVDDNQTTMSLTVRIIVSWNGNMVQPMVK
jgi:hypothetical protein